MVFLNIIEREEERREEREGEEIVREGRGREREGERCWNILYSLEGNNVFVLCQKLSTIIHYIPFCDTITSYPVLTTYCYLYQVICSCSLCKIVGDLWR